MRTSRLRSGGMLAAALLVTLALATTARADPPAPVLAPIPYYVCPASLTVSWQPSQPDPGATIVAYEFRSTDLVSGATLTFYTKSTTFQLGGLVMEHLYAIRVRAIEVNLATATVQKSAPAGDSFKRHCLLVPPQPLTWWWPTDEPDPRTPVAALYPDQPRLAAAIRSATLVSSPTTFRGLQVDAAGETTLLR